MSYVVVIDRPGMPRLYLAHPEVYSLFTKHLANAKRFRGTADWQCERVHRTCVDLGIIADVHIVDLQTAELNAYG